MKCTKKFILILFFLFTLPEVYAVCGNATIVDSDNDNSSCNMDCNDANSFIFPGNANYFCDCNNATFGFSQGTFERCGDHYDNNCDGQIDEALCVGCEITKAAWDLKNATEGENVSLEIKTTNCVEQKLDIFIYSFSNNTTEYLIFNTSTFVLNESFKIKWAVQWGKNLTGNLSTYIILAYVEQSNISSDFITINKKKQCIETWNCSSWGSCVNEKRQRNCIDTNACSTLFEKPADEEGCKSEPACSNNKKDNNEEGVDCGIICSYGRETACSNSLDDDRDCDIDCEDSDCKNEVLCGGEPFILPDSDSDGLADEKEIMLGTNILSNDTDQDNINDKEDAFPLCPNNSCDIKYGETEQNCPKDCKKKSAVLPMLVSGLIMLLIIAFGVYIWIKKPFKKKSLFKTPTDLIKLKTYIKQQLEKKISLEKVINSLLEKKWNKKQILYAINEIKNEAAKKKIAQKK